MRSSVFLVLCCLLVPKAAQAFTEGNLLVTNTLGQIREYTMSGSLVQTLAVPAPPVSTGGDGIRDVVLDQFGAPHVFNGVFHAYISSQDRATGGWSHHTIPGFSIASTVTYGKVAIYGDTVFATDGFTGSGGGPQGIIRYNVKTSEMSRFAPPINPNDGPIDVAVGYDGLLYCLEGEGSPPGRSVSVYDPVTFALLRRMVLPDNFVYVQGGCSSIAVDANGFIYLNRVSGQIFKFSPSLVQLSSATYTHSLRTTDLQALPDGRFVLSGYDGRITILSNTFQQLGTFATFSNTDANSFVAYVQQPVPEPPAIIVCVGGLLVLRALRLLNRSRRSSRTV
jgi:hypothetical protein